MSRRLVATLGAVASVAIAVTGCGSKKTSNPVSRAATATLGSGGYKMSAVVSITGTASPVTAKVKGEIDAASGSGTMTIDESVDGEQIHVPAIFSALNFWMKSAGIPGAAQRTGGKAWVYVDMNKALGAMGVASLPSTVNPSQFLDYLRTVGTSPTRVGPVSINGVHTTQYRAMIDLGRYAQQYHVSGTSISQLESALGGHSMPVQAWVDGHNRVRRIYVAFPECVEGKRLQFSMTMGVYGFGTHPHVQIPSRSAVYNLTPLLATASHSLRLGCSSAG